MLKRSQMELALQATDSVTVKARWARYRLMPYERRLGMREVSALCGVAAESDDDAVTSVGDGTYLASRLTYFEEVSVRGARIPTAQAQAEARHLAGRDGQSSRQATRYGLHGIHEYKGKFNPQIVRALCNIVDPEASTLADPFQGSGTALVEGLRLDMDVFGADRSPIAHFLASAKLEAMAAARPSALRRAFDALAAEVADRMDAAQEAVIAADLRTLRSERSVDYLRRWFTEPAYAAVSTALSVLEPHRETTEGKLALVALSSILRQVSLQLPEDLRVRRRPEPYTAPPLAAEFIRAASIISEGLRETAAWPRPEASWALTLGSAEDATTYRWLAGRSRRLIVTSPPYATALPYIDTDRLSLVALGLADATEVMPLEQALVGSREWPKSEQRTWDERRVRNSDALPDALTGLLSYIAAANTETGAGFRRHAVPSLLYRYFARMGRCIDAWAEALDSGEKAVLIVGHNHTTAGGERIDIPTPALLAGIASARGFRVDEIIPLETWPRYGMHAHNGVNGEDAVVLCRS